MQPWTVLDDARRAIHAAFEHDFIYDNTATYLAAIAEAHATLQHQFSQPPNTRDYWTGRNACKEILVRTAMITQDAHHGIGEDNPTPPNPTYLAFLNRIGETATVYETEQPRYAHWDDYDAQLTLWQSTLATAYAIPPDSRDRSTILDTLETIAARTCLFISRAAFTTGDRDPHTRDNYATWKAVAGKWTLRDNNCHPGFSPVAPDFPPNKPDETLCMPCQEYAYRRTAPPQTPRPAPQFRDAHPYHALQTPTAEAGIVTAATTEHWPMLGAMALTANLHRYPIAIADHGLSPEIRTALNRFRVHWIDHVRPNIPEAMPPHHAIAPPKAWWKPWVCLASPWDRSLWIDADAIPLTNLDPALHPDTDEPLLTRNDRFSAQSFQLYRAIHTALFPTLAAPTRDTPQTICNTGILAWTRGDALIPQWIDAALQIIPSPQLQTLANCRDQSAMYAALVTRHAHNQAPPTYLPLHWNWPADGLWAKDTDARRPLPTDPARLLAVTRRRHPTAIIVHWLGTPKPNDLYETTNRKA